MLKPILGLLVSCAILIAMMLTGCSDEPALSLNDYLAELDCESFQGGDKLETYGDMAADLSQVITRMSSLVPPAEIADWHRAGLTTFEKTRDAVDEFPKGGAIDFAGLVGIAESIEAEEAKHTEIVAGLPADIGRQMVEAGCIDPEDVSDDHGNDYKNSSALTVGESVEGTIDYEADSDYFRFNAEEGQLYRIEATLGTLDAAGITVWKLETETWITPDAGTKSETGSDDPVILWKPRKSGDHFVEMTGAGESEAGRYTLTVSPAVDDHADDIDGATVISPGVAVEGVIDYYRDSDFFQFTAEAGHLYRLDMTSSAEYFSAVVYVRDPECGGDGLCWAAGFDSNDASEYQDGPDSWNSWHADERHDRYILVEGQQSEPGASYTLTITDVVDDHANTIVSATPITVGTPVEGVIDWEDDDDYFRFTAEAGKEYRIDVALGTLSEWDVRVMDSNGTELESSWEGGGQTLWEAVASGDYYVEMKRGASWVGRLAHTH